MAGKTAKTKTGKKAVQKGPPPPPVQLVEGALVRREGEAGVLFVTQVVELTPQAVKAFYEANPNTNAFEDDEQSKLAGIQEGAQVNPTAAAIAAAYASIVRQVSAAEKAEGTETGLRTYSPSDIQDMIANFAGNGGDGDMTPAEIRDAIQSLTGVDRLAASAIKDLPPSGYTTAQAVRDALVTLIEDARLPATAVAGLEGFYDSPEELVAALMTLVGAARLPASALRDLTADLIATVGPLAGSTVQAELEAIRTELDGLPEAGEVSARDVAVEDAGGHFPNVTKNVEAILANIAQRIAAGVTPVGPAGGMLRGNYPNPSFELVNSITPGTYVRATVTVDEFGRIVGIIGNTAGNGDGTGGTDQRAVDVPVDAPLTEGTVQAELEDIRDNLGVSSIPTKREILNASGTSVIINGLNDDPRWITVSRNGVEQTTQQFSIPSGGGQMNFAPALNGENVIVNFIN